MRSALVSALSMAVAVNAHGHVQAIIADGVTYVGGLPYNAPADAVGWAAGNQDNGFVEPASFGTPDIICHKSATPVANSVPVSAGDTITLEWNTWPESHHGPVIDYLAPVSGEFTAVDKTSLSFVKIGEAGLVSGYNPGLWAADDLIADGFSWDVTIPAGLAPGNYVLRHEIIALHAAGNVNGAQAYPQCINIEVTSGGSTAISGGEPATEFYTETDPGILFNLYETFDSYPIPGPALWT